MASSTISSRMVAIVVLTMLGTLTLLPRPAAAEDDACTFVTQRIQCKSLTCNESSGQCVPCTHDAQCYQGAYGCHAGQCVLRPLADTFTSRTLLAPLAGFVVCAIAVLAGVGGGAILGPLFNVILEIPFSDAVALSQAVICGQSLLNVSFQIFRTHKEHSYPNPTRPNINYEYCLLLLPIALSGTYLGAVGNKVSPNWLRVVLLIVIFSYALVRLIQRIRREKAASDAEQLAGDQAAGVVTPGAHREGGDGRLSTTSANSTEEEVLAIGVSTTSSMDRRPSAATAAAAGGTDDSSKTIVVAQQTPHKVMMVVSTCDDKSPHAAVSLDGVDTPTLASSSNGTGDETTAALAPTTTAATTAAATGLYQRIAWAIWTVVVIGIFVSVAPNWLRAVMFAALVGIVIKRLIDDARLSPAIGTEEKPQFPVNWMLGTLGVLVVFTTISLVTKNFMACGSPVYFSMLAVVPAIGIGISCGVRAYLARLYQKVLAGELPPAAVPFEWSTKTTIVFPLVCVVAGFAATMLGIGGGLVLSSLLLEAGLAPSHASATSGLATLIIATQSIITLMIGGRLRSDYALLCFASGLASTLFGRLVLLREIERRNATYLIVVALAVIMGGSMLAITAYGVANTVKIYMHDGSLGFGPLCSLVPTTTLPAS